MRARVASSPAFLAMCLAATTVAPDACASSFTDPTSALGVATFFLTPSVASTRRAAAAANFCACAAGRFSAASAAVRSCAIAADTSRACARSASAVAAGTPPACTAAARRRVTSSTVAAALSRRRRASGSSATGPSARTADMSPRASSSDSCAAWMTSAFPVVCAVAMSPCTLVATARAASSSSAASSSVTALPRATALSALRLLSRSCAALRSACRASGLCGCRVTSSAALSRFATAFARARAVASTASSPPMAPEVE
mmetsp:Transcript_2425/g.7730  ORF Transcript_2425/g.7730 Transcript_2425/m.7730 type:complete len:259 (+) Transcript_2425:4309-5085(+)